MSYRRPLEFIGIADLPPAGAGEVLFRERLWSGIIGMFVGLGSIVVATGFWLTNETDLVVDLFFWLWTSVLLLIGLIARGVLARALRPSNWLCRMGEDGVYLHLRSYLNSVGDDGGDETVLWLPWFEVRWARAVKRRQTRLRAGHGSSHDVKEIEWVRFLDIQLRDDAVAEDLRTRLKAERARIHTQKKTTAQFHHWPVQALDDGAFRVAFKSRYDNVTPSLAKAVEIAEQHVRLVWVRHDDQAILGQSPKAREKRIVAHVQRGEKLDAIKLARIAYGYDLEEAKEFVEGLEGKGS